MSDPIQQQLAQARRNQILDAAAAVFAEKGFHRATIKDIAAHAGIADGTIYNYFSNKAALLIGLFERMRDTVAQDEALLALNQMDLHTFLMTLIRQPLMAFHDDDFALFRVIIAEIMVNDELRALYFKGILQPTVELAEQYLTQWADANEMHNLDVALTVRMIVSAVTGLMIGTIMGDPVLVERWDTLPESLASTIIDGIKGENKA